MVGIMKSHLYTWSRIFLALYITSMLSSAAGGIVIKENDEDRLYKALMTNYVKTSRPVLVSNSTGVTVDLNIAQPRLETLETATDTMTLSYWITMTWQDERLKWNTSDFGGLPSIRVSPDSIWLPEMEVFNVSPFHPSKTMKANVIVSASGFIMYIPAQTVSFFCSLDLAKFPYDTQTCKLSMGPWTYSSTQQDLTYQGKTEAQEIATQAASGDVHKSHPQWTLNKMTARIVHTKYACCPDKYVTVEVDITVTRVASYYRLALVGPSIFLAILIPVVFLLPPDQTCRTNYGMILLMTMTVLMVVLQEAVPFDHATVPVLAVFYFGIFVLQFFSILCCVFTGCLRERGGRRKALPAWLGSMCLHSRGLRRCLCLDTNFSVYNDPDTPMNARLIEEQQDTAHDSGLANVDITVPDDHFREVANNTKIMAGKILRESTYDKLQRDWQEVSRCLDRLFFVTFVFVIAVVALSTVL